jgi:hypothetical protein
LPKKVLLTNAVIEHLQSKGYNGFYLQGCKQCNQYVLVPTAVEELVDSQELMLGLFQRSKLFNSTEIVEMLSGVEFIDFVVQLPEQLPPYRKNLS